jgi:hypothetical protein
MLASQSYTATEVHPLVSRLIAHFQVDRQDLSISIPRKQTWVRNSISNRRFSECLSKMGVRSRCCVHWMIEKASLFLCRLASPRSINR